MNMKKTALSAAMLGVMGTVGMAVPTVASAVHQPHAGTWELTIAVTPNTTSYVYPSYATACDAGGTVYCTTSIAIDVGSKKTGWNTSFTFGSTPGAASVPGLNTGTNVTVTNDWSAYYGTGPGTYGTASSTQTDFGRLVFDIDGAGAISSGATPSFQMDTFFATAGGDFAQFILGGVNASTFSGGFTIDASGNVDMNLGIANRFGAINGPAGGVIGPWNYEPAPFVDASGNPLTNPQGQPIDLSGNVIPPLGFTTGSLPDPGAGTISGSSCTSVGAGEWDCVLVSYGQVGSAWGTFKGNPYYEVWDIHLHQISAAIPVPAAVWLFGSGLLGLVGVARRKKTG